jgi:hypothetical protein
MILEKKAYWEGDLVGANCGERSRIFIEQASVLCVLLMTLELGILVARMEHKG